MPVLHALEALEVATKILTAHLSATLWPQVSISLEQLNPPGPDDHVSARVVIDLRAPLEAVQACEVALTENDL